MRDIKVTRPTQISVDANFPVSGKAKNITSKGDNTGTPWIEDIINDRSFGWQERILSIAGIVPNGLEENAAQSQISEAIEILIKIISSGYNAVGSFRWGLVYNSDNDVGIYQGKAYKYVGGDSYPVTVPANTVDPSLASDYEEVVYNPASNVGLEEGISVQEKFDKFKDKFDTVSEATNYNKISKLLGSRVWLADRKAWFEVVLTATAGLAVNGMDLIQSEVNASYSFLLENTGDIFAHNLGFSSNDFVDLQPFLDRAMEGEFNLKIKKDNYTMSSGEIRWNPTIEVDFCGSYVLCELGAKITNKYIASDAGSTNSYAGYRCYFKNLRIEGAGRSASGSGVWSQGNTEALTGGKDFSRCKTSNIQVTECNPALEINTFNTYLVENESTMLERGDTLIQVNDGGVNSGENFKFTGNGIFAVCNDVLVLNEACDISFIGSSFDFIQGNPVVFNSGYCYIKHIGCYYEKATKNGLARSSGSYFNSVLMLTDPTILAREYEGYAQNANAGNNKIFTGTNVLYKCDGLRIKRELYNADPSDYDLCGDEIQQLKLTNVMRDQFRGQCLGPKFSTNLNSDLELSNNGDGITTTGVDGFVDSNIAGGYDWTIQNFVFYTSNKAIEATLDGTTSTFCDILTSMMECKPMDTLVAGFKLHGGDSVGNIQVNSVVRFYDIDGNVISNLQFNHGNMLDIYNDTDSPLYTGNRTYWIGVPSREISNIPSGAVSCDVKMVLSNFTGTVYVDDVCVNIF